ncbi:SLC13 family permease [Actinomyces wuliandei]|uniref:GntT/GntP/DsdX family permease n=1 Tax=Actinomyces wuliandei TaxID=2057743 RepID=UPI00311A9F52
MPEITESGLGGQFGSTLLVIGLGAMIGRVVGDAGAARRIAVTIIDRLGERGVQWAMTVTSVLIEVTMFYEVAFVIIVPVAFTLVRATGRPLLWVGLPMSITLSTMHSFLPPHPGPTAVAGFYNVSVGLTLAIGLVVALPVGALISWLWPRLSLVRRMSPQIPEGLISDKELTEEQMPGLLPSLSVAPLPVVLIAGAAIYDMTRSADNLLTDVIAFVGSPPVALLACLLVACWVFGPHVGRTLSEVGESMSGGARAMAMILMVIGAGGAFKEVLDAIGVDEYIAEVTRTWTGQPAPAGLADRCDPAYRPGLGDGRGHHGRRDRRPAGHRLGVT